MKPFRLTSLAQLNDSVCVPGYTPQDHGVGIVHLGVGAFHRAHQAVMTDSALAQQGGDWRIVGVSLRSKSVANALNAQNGLYTLIERGGSATSARVIASISHVVAADPQATLEALCDPNIRIVTLTVTEAGYGIDRVNRFPDTNNATVIADVAQPDTPKGVLGLLVKSIACRREGEHCPFTVLSCDNLPENGALLRDGVIGFARCLNNDELADWIADNIAFPSCMVDRITPAPTTDTHHEALKQTGCDDQASIETEPFTQWIIEDNFPSGRPQWEAGGALFVSDVTPYERMKLMMLNGSHSMLAYAGYLTGHLYVRDVMADANLSMLVQRHFNAASRLLKPLARVNFDDYAVALAKRFANPAIAHETYQIASDGTQKLPQRIFQPALEALEAEKSVRPFAFATAMWMRYCLCRLDDGSPYELRDPRAEDIIAAIGKSDHTAGSLSDVLHALPQLIPQRLAFNGHWRHDVHVVLDAILEHGCLAAIQHEIDTDFATPPT